MAGGKIANDGVQENSASGRIKPLDTKDRLIPGALIRDEPLTSGPSVVPRHAALALNLQCADLCQVSPASRCGAGRQVGRGSGVMWMDSLDTVCVSATLGRHLDTKAIVPR